MLRIITIFISLMGRRKGEHVYDVTLLLGQGHYTVIFWSNCWTGEQRYKCKSSHNVLPYESWTSFTVVCVQ